MRTLREVRRRGYAGKTGLAQAEVIRLVALPTRALVRFPLGGAAAQLPYRIYGIDLGTRALVAKCHALGLEVHYWTVNEPALATRLLDAGADAIMTDDPRAIAPVLESRRSAPDLSRRAPRERPVAQDRRVFAASRSGPRSLKLSSRADRLGEGERGRRQRRRFRQHARE